jgi:hypothetical protein
LNTQTAGSLTGCDLIVGDDHGKGRFRLVLMLILCLDGDPIKKRFILGENDCKKDTMLEQNARLRKIAEGKLFIITKDSEGQLGVVFTSQPPAAGTVVIKSVPSRVFACGDLKFYAQVLGREHMDSVWFYVVQDQSQNV